MILKKIKDEKFNFNFSCTLKYSGRNVYAETSNGGLYVVFGWGELSGWHNTSLGPEEAAYVSRLLKEDLSPKEHWVEEEKYIRFPLEVVVKWSCDMQKIFISSSLGKGELRLYEGDRMTSLEQVEANYIYNLLEGINSHRERLALK